MQSSQSPNSSVDDPPVPNPAGEIINVEVVPTPPTETVNIPADTDDVYEPSTFDKVAQAMLDALREAWNLDPTGEQRAVIVAVTSSHGKVYEIKADSTADQIYKGQEIWGKAFVEAEVTKTMTAFATNNK